MERYSLNYLQQLEAESIHIIREVIAEFRNPVMLYSAGKDSSVMLRLAQKAFYPAKIPFPLLHIDTGYKFKEMIEFRDYYTKKIGANLIVCQNTEEVVEKMGPEDSHTDNYIYYKKTKPLLEAIRHHGFDAALGGARRDEEKSRSKERIFSFRSEAGVWDPKSQRPELWHLYNANLHEGESMRIFPLSNWTELDVWTYIKQENIEIVPLYFSQRRKVVRRGDAYLIVGEHVVPCYGEEVLEINCRCRTLGCSSSTGVVPSDADTLDGIIEELLIEKNSERAHRAIDYASECAMEQKKKQGYF